MPTNSDKDFQNVRDKVNQIDQRVEEIILPTLVDIKSTLSKMSYVAKDEYAKDREADAKWRAKVDAFMNNASPAVKFFSALNSRWTQILIGGLIMGAVIAVASQIPKLGITL